MTNISYVRCHAYLFQCLHMKHCRDSQLNSTMGQKAMDSDSTWPAAFFLVQRTSLTSPVLTSEWRTSSQQPVISEGHVWAVNNNHVFAGLMTTCAYSKVTECPRPTLSYRCKHLQQATKSSTVLANKTYHAHLSVWGCFATVELRQV